MTYTVASVFFLIRDFIKGFSCCFPGCTFRAHFLLHSCWKAHQINLNHQIKKIKVKIKILKVYSNTRVKYLQHILFNICKKAVAKGSTPCILSHDKSTIKLLLGSLSKLIRGCDFSEDLGKIWNILILHH